MRWVPLLRWTRRRTEHLRWRVLPNLYALLVKFVRSQLAEASTSVCHERELDAEREVAERLKLMVAGRYDLLALFPAVAKERRVVADQDNHGDALAELRQDLFDKPRVGHVESDINGGKQPVTRGEIPRLGQLALRVSIGNFHRLGFLRDCLKRWNRFVNDNPGQFIFYEDRFLGRKRSWIVERCNRHIDCVRVLAVFEKQMSAATRGKRTDPIRVLNLAQVAFCHDQIVARHCSPSDIRRSRTFLAIDAVTINHRQWPTLQHVSGPATNTSTSQLHKIRLNAF
jgi:hypothetical protein